MNQATLQAKVDDLVRRIEEARSIKEIAASDAWKFLSRTIEHGILIKFNRVCQVECPADESVTLRAEIRALRWFLRIPQIDDANIAKAVQTVQGLREKVKRLQSLGLGQSDTEASEVSNEVDSLNRNLQGLP